MDFKVMLIGTSQLSFPGDKAGRFHKAAEELKVFLADLGASLVVYPENVITAEDAKRSLTMVHAEKPDFLLVQNTSYSAGFLAMVYGKAGYPLGQWAIPEGGVDGIVQFNSFCSINMHMSIIKNYYPHDRIPVKWFFSEVNDEMFAKRMRTTIKALRTIKRMKQSKIALIGGIAPGFNDLYFDERDMLKRFEGMEFNRLHEFDEIGDRAMSYSDSEIAKMAEEYEAKAKLGVQPCSVRHKMMNARFLKAYNDFLAEYQYDAIAISCWPKFMDKFDYSICSVVASLNDQLVPAACEGDVPSAVSMLMLQEITGKSTMCMDMSAFDEKDESVLMWHCGAAAAEFCCDAGYSLGGNYSGKAHIPDEPPICCGVARDMVFKAQPAMIGRMTGNFDQLLVCAGEFLDEKKPSFIGSRGWMGNLTVAGEKCSARDMVATVLDQSLPHHFALGVGDQTDVLMEIAAWLDLDVIQKSTYTDYMKR